MHDSELIEAYIKKVRSIDRIYFVDSKKNQTTRFLLRWTVEDMENAIKGIELCHYVKGPEPDRDPIFGGNVWVFKRIIDGHMIYIKIKDIDETTDIKALKCLSCHISTKNE